MKSCGDHNLGDAWKWLNAKALNMSIPWVQASFGPSLIEAIASISTACRLHDPSCDVNCPFRPSSIVLLSFRNSRTINDVFVSFEAKASATFSKAELIYNGKPLTKAVTCILPGKTPAWMGHSAGNHREAIGLKGVASADFVTITVVLASEEMPFAEMVDKIRDGGHIKTGHSPATIRVQSQL
jgi:hypothetical protein